jgi:hypothetical protein
MLDSVRGLAGGIQTAHDEALRDCLYPSLKTMITSKAIELDIVAYVGEDTVAAKSLER